ncbi:ABC transporter ATP-binding protein, partial [Acidianus sp. RZ1]|uniref:ABC transporter ATP-binding protein n=1 Tax=Acidianus sp. RZ1 TaxID=1540082 RepID=UPI001491E45E|nr:ABC transporter ATP-binding protein [Acidianus sp. RZ1]
MSSLNSLEISSLSTYYTTKRGYLKAVDKVSLNLPKGSVLGLAGESGSGKSTIVNTIFRVLPKNAIVKEGSIMFNNEDLLKMNLNFFRKEISWKKISWIPQGSMSILDPVYTVKSQMIETINAHEDISRAEAMEIIYKSLKAVNLPDDVLNKYPHQLSGGQKQRIVIASALLLDPEIVVADEPTTALDVVVQAEIVKLIKELQKQRGFSMIFVTHDLSLLAGVSNYLAILYGGKLVELGTTEDIFKDPLHPYTQMFLKAIPDIRKWKERKLYYIPGELPDLISPPKGCIFNPRCPLAGGICKESSPGLEEVSKGHLVA